MTDLKALPKSALADLKREGVDLIQWWVQIEESKTEVLRRLATVVVGIRAQFRTEDGSPDWRGKTWDYRQFIGDMYGASGVPPDSASNIQAALRYHVGNLLREVVPGEDLAAAGLKESSPRDRMLAARQEIQALATAIAEDLQSGDRKTASTATAS